MFKTGFRRLKQWNVSAITATIWGIVTYLSESVKFTELPTSIFMTKRDIYDQWRKYQKGVIESTFFNLDFLPNWITTGRAISCPLWFNFINHRTSIVKVTFNRDSGGCLAPDTHFTAVSWKSHPDCPESANFSCLSSWTPAQHSVTAGSYSNACDKLLETVFSAAGRTMC